MADCHYENERTMTKPSAGGTVTRTTTGGSTLKNDMDKSYEMSTRSESKTVLRKRRRTEPTSPRTVIPRKTPRRTGKLPVDTLDDNVLENLENSEKNIANLDCPKNPSQTKDSTSESQKICKPKEIFDESDSSKGNEFTKEIEEKKRNSVEGFEDDGAKEISNMKSDENQAIGNFDEEEMEQLTTKPPIHPDPPRRRSMGFSSINRRDDSARLRKTIQWLEDGARKLREDLAEARAELYEERRAARIARREIETAIREARAAESSKHQRVIAELKTRLSQSPSRSTMELSSASTKADLLKEENHRREISAAKKRLAEADATIRKLRSSSLDPSTGNSNGKRRKVETPAASELKKSDAELKALRIANKKLEEKLNTVCMEADKIRTTELRIQSENHEAAINALKKSLRSDVIRMMDEIRGKDREIERLRRNARENRRSCTKEDDGMRKLRENENSHQIRLAARIEDKIPQVDNVIDLCKGECEAVAEVERLRELAIEQQELIELLRQAVKEKERKLDQLSNKRRKEEFYKQWLELEPVAEVDDEDEHEEGDSALSSAPSSLSPQPGGCGHWQNNGVTREAYEAVLFEIDQMQTKFLEQQQELSHAKSQVRDLEKALLQETRGSQNSRRALTEKLRKLEEREASLLAEIAELGEQNELLEFRVLELEESPGLRETPDTVDSGIVSPEPVNIFKQEQNNKQRDRAVATVVPFSSYTHPTSPVPVKKQSLSLQESGIFEGDDEENDEEDEEQVDNNREIEFASCGTQTEAPVGELLQEVQRLQELRERIQERAVKVPSGSLHDGKTPQTLETNDTKIQEEQSVSYREKIRHLEKRLSTLEEEQETKFANDLLVKQREEDLLDENYRLTERVYWLENELRNFETEKKTFVSVETMTEDKNLLVHRETMTHNAFAHAETMTETLNGKSLVVQNVPADKDEEKEDTNFTEISSSSRCGNIFRSALRENIDKASSASKPLTTEVESFSVAQKLQQFGNDDKAIIRCDQCEMLRKDYDERVEKLAKAECKIRGRLIDLEKKEGAFAMTLKHVDTTWSQLEADHARNLEEIGRRLEEKVECNRRILQRVAELEMLASQKKKESCSCKCDDAASSSADISDEFSSNDCGTNGSMSVDYCCMQLGEDTVDHESMEIDGAEEENMGTMKIVKQKSQGTQSDRVESFQCPNCSSERQRIDESLRRVPLNGTTKQSMEDLSTDTSTEIGVEATEEIASNIVKEFETSDSVSRVHLTPEVENPAPEPTEIVRVAINETEIDKKVRESRRKNETVDCKGNGWVVKNWNTETCYSKNGVARRAKRNNEKKYVFRHRGLHYVLYPEICV